MNKQTAPLNKQEIDLLHGGGEMGNLIRLKDWSQNSVGPIEDWPQSLKITLNILLNSKFPMFLWWGEELIQFYNDGYRPSFGKEGKHPMALGQRGQECWPEIWPIIKPQIDQVLTTGVPTWNENHLVPIFRNGVLEDVYWTYSYSPVYNDFAKVEGVLVIVNETTQNIFEIKEKEKFIQEISNASPCVIGLYELPSQKYIYINREIHQMLGYPPEDTSGVPFHKIIHPDDEELLDDTRNDWEGLRDEDAKEIECRLKNYNGEWLWFFVRMKVFKRDINNKPFQIILAAQDITYRKKLEEETSNLKLSKQKEVLNAILQAQEEERERVGEALHNGLGQLLYAIKLNFEMYKSKYGIDLENDKTLSNEINALIIEAMDQTKKISFELMPGLLKDFGLEEALKQFARKLDKNFRIIWEISGMNKRLSDDVEIAIFRIIQELINNIVKYAEVKEAKIQLLINGDMINVMVEDKGVGIDFEKINLNHKGLGLQNIKNRVNLLNGKFTLVSKPGEGTRATIAIDQKMIAKK